MGEWELKPQLISQNEPLMYGYLTQSFFSAHTFLDQRTLKMAQLNSLVNSATLYIPKEIPNLMIQS